MHGHFWIFLRDFCLGRISALVSQTEFDHLKWRKEEPKAFTTESRGPNLLPRLAFAWEVISRLQMFRKLFSVRMLRLFFVQLKRSNRTLELSWENFWPVIASFDVKSLDVFTVDSFVCIHSSLTPGHVSASDSHPVKGWDQIAPIAGDAWVFYGHRSCVRLPFCSYPVS